MLSNKNFNAIVTELFIRGRELNVSLVFITQSLFLNENSKQKGASINSIYSFIRY